MGGAGVSSQTQAQLGGLRNLGVESSRPQPQLPAFCSQSISWQRKKRAEGQKAGEIGRGRGAQRKGTLGGGGELCKWRNRPGSSAINKSFSSSSWYHRSSSAGWLPVLARDRRFRGESRVPQTKRGPRPLHPRDNSNEGHQEKARTPATSLGGSRWGPRVGGSLSWGSSEPPSFVLAS